MDLPLRVAACLGLWAAGGGPALGRAVCDGDGRYDSTQDKFGPPA